MTLLPAVFAATHNPLLAETGGTHNQKGVDFQRYWTLWRAFEAEAAGRGDFLFLVESVQDVLELDSETAPTTACICQLKKRDSGEWAWKDLTALDGPPSLKKDGTPKKKRQTKDAASAPSFTDSPLGKLALSMRELGAFTVTAHFISNAGCSVPLASPPGGTASSAQECRLDQIETRHAAILRSAVLNLYSAGEQPFTLEQLHLVKTSLNPDNPEDALVGRVNDLLAQRSPSHAAQARTLVRGLFISISAKGRHTGLCENFDKLRVRRGFGKSDMVTALADLEKIPDFESIRTSWLARLVPAMTLVEHTSLSIAVARRRRAQLVGSAGIPDSTRDVQEWVQANPPDHDLLAFLVAGHQALHGTHAQLSKMQLYALLLDEGVRFCVDQTSDASYGA